MRDLPSIEPEPKFGNAPIGSPQSRARVRLVVERRHRSENLRQVLFCHAGLDRVRAGEWFTESDGTLTRVISLPGGADMVDSLRTAGGFSKAEIAEVGAENPVVPKFEIMTLECKPQ